MSVKIPISTLELTDPVVRLLEDAGYEDAEQLVFAMETKQDTIEAIKGIGPKTLEQIDRAINNYKSKTPEETEKNDIEKDAEEAEETIATNDVIKEEPVYAPPIPSMADYFKPPECGKQLVIEKGEEKTEDTTPSYAPPVPPLASYYHSEKRQILPEPTTYSSPPDKPKKKEKTKNKKKKDKQKKKKPKKVGPSKKSTKKNKDKYKKKSKNNKNKKKKAKKKKR
jgi:hypothetical protein